MVSCHAYDVTKKANKRIYCLSLLKRPNSVSQEELLKIYCSCIRPTLEYCSPVFNHSLSGYLSDDLEHIQKRALSIINPGVSSVAPWPGGQGDHAPARPPLLLRPVGKLLMLSESSWRSCGKSATKFGKSATKVIEILLSGKFFTKKLFGKRRADTCQNLFVSIAI